jgi:arylsulfatase A-like enzyme
VTVEQPTISTDIYPTLLEVAGIPLMPGQHRDGVSLAPLLRRSGTLDRSELYWHFPHYHGSGNRPSGAVRSGDFKLLEWLEDGRIELYNLTADPGEINDLSSEMPGKANELLTLLHSWRESVDANMPRANPTWKDQRGGQS